MPYLDSPVAAFQQASTARETDFDLISADAEETILAPSLARKGHLVRNIGTSEVTVIYGMPNLETEENTEVYRVLLSPNAAYLQDFVEVIPYAAISPVDGGSIRVIELY